MRKLFFIILALSLICNNITAQRDTTSIESEGSVFFSETETGVNNKNGLIAETRFILSLDLPAQLSTWPQTYFLPREIDYLKKSRRQKTTAWILLGTGSALIITGIVAAYSADNDPIAGAISLVFISGTGIGTSLISIPFFAASRRNKKRAIAASSSIGFMQKPALTGIVDGKRYPALTVKMSF